MPQSPNATGFVFKDEEGSFLVGFIAGTFTRKRVVGMIGWINIPSINRFLAGFQAGV